MRGKVLCHIGGAPRPTFFSAAFNGAAADVEFASTIVELHLVHAALQTALQGGRTKSINAGSASRIPVDIRYHQRGIASVPHLPAPQLGHRCGGPGVLYPTAR